MENILTGLCGTGPEDPLPLWVHGSIGHCFNQLTLNAVPHTILAAVSACFLGTPRYDNRLVLLFIIVQEAGWKTGN